MKLVGVEELMFTSDEQSNLANSLKLRPADDVMLTINFMRDKGGIKNLSVIQVRPHGHKDHMTIMLIT